MFNLKYVQFLFLFLVNIIYNIHTWSYHSFYVEHIHTFSHIDKSMANLQQKICGEKFVKIWENMLTIFGRSFVKYLS